MGLFGNNPGRMKIHILTGLAITLVASMASAAVTNAVAVASPFKSDLEKASYCVGMSIAHNWKRQGVEFDSDAVSRGLKDGLADKTLVTEQEARETLSAYQQVIRAKLEEKRKADAEKNRVAGDKFLAENKGKPGVVTLPSGLQYKILTDGKGESPQAADTVTVHYRGTLIDGTEFDSSYKRGEPATFPVSGVIRGWTEALQLMKPGAKWQLFIPSGLAYGENAPPNIGPNSMLLFDVELISVQPAPPSQPVTSDIIRVPSAEEIKRGAKPETIKADQLEKEMRKQTGKP